MNLKVEKLNMRNGRSCERKMKQDIENESVSVFFIYKGILFSFWDKDFGKRIC